MGCSATARLRHLCEGLAVPRPGLSAGCMQVRRRREGRRDAMGRVRPQSPGSAQKARGKDRQTQTPASRPVYQRCCPALTVSGLVKTQGGHAAAVTASPWIGVRPECARLLLVAGL